MPPRRLVFGGVSVEAPPGWEDITQELEGDVPFTLARNEDGVGALQFSIALYKGGREPGFSVEALEQLQAAFASTHEVSSPFCQEVVENQITMVATSFRYQDDDFMRVWHVSDKVNLVMITYVCEWQDQEVELAQCEVIVQSLKFERGDA